jgi:GAF domain-containing protein
MFDQLRRWWNGEPRVIPPAADPAPAAMTDAPAADLAEHPEANGARKHLPRETEDLLKKHAAQARSLERARGITRRQEEELAALRPRVRELESAAATQESLLNQQRARIAELEDALAAEHRVSAQLPSLQSAHEALAAEVTAVQASRGRLQGEVQKTRGEISAQHATLAARAGEIAQLLGRITDAESQARDYKRDAEVNQGIIAQLQVQAEGLADLQSRYAQLQSDCQKLHAGMVVKEDELATARQALQESIATLKAVERLSGTLEWKSTLDRVLGAASERIEFERGTLLLLDELQNELKVEAALNSPIDISQMSRFKVGEGLAGRVVAEKQALLIVNTKEDQRFKVRDPSHQPRSMIVVPLRSGDEVLGALSLVRPATRPFGEGDLRAAEAVALEAARALNNARLFHVLKERELRLESLVQRSWDLSVSLEPKQVLAAIIRGAQQLMGGGAALIALMDTETYAMEVVAADQIPERILFGPGTAWGEPVARDVLRTGKPWLAPVAELVPAEQRQTLEALDMHYLISVPVRSTSEILSSLDGGTIAAAKSGAERSPEVYGILNLYRKDTSAPPAEQLNALLAFGYQAARALKNVKRWERLNTEMQTAQSLNARLLGRERFISQLQLKIGKLEEELSRWRQ